jgi:GT2 family glycosyltransferase
MTFPTLGVVVVTFNSADVILECLESLLASTGVCLRIVVVDNGSTDGTPALLRDWATGGARPAGSPLPFALPPVARPLVLYDHVPPVVVGPDSSPDAGAGGSTVTLIDTGLNTGFAGGVNRGLAVLAAVPGIDRFWVLNPDSAVPPETARAFATHPAPPGGFALMGGRVIYLDRPDMIQIDGGTLNRRTGVTDNLNRRMSHAATPPPDPARLDFITGASMVASRAFYEAAGPMAEDYFLYYEEVDWALRRGALPLIYCPGGIVYHVGGTAIGSPVAGRAASAFSLYFKHRGRIRFMRRHFPQGMATAQAHSLAKAAQLLFRGAPGHAHALLAGAMGLAPPAGVRDRLSPEAAGLAFGKVSRKA